MWILGHLHTQIFALSAQVSFTRIRQNIAHVEHLTTCDITLSSECSQLSPNLCCLHHRDSHFLADLASAHRLILTCCGNEKVLQRASGKMGSSVLTARPKTGRLKCCYIIHVNVCQSSKPCRCFLLQLGLGKVFSSPTAGA